jgi:hypothetical protein
LDATKEVQKVSVSLFLQKEISDFLPQKDRAEKKGMDLSEEKEDTQSHREKMSSKSPEWSPTSVLSRPDVSGVFWPYALNQGHKGCKIYAVF